MGLDVVQDAEWRCSPAGPGAQHQAARHKTDIDVSNYVLETTKNAWNTQKSGSIYMNRVPKS